METTIRVVPSGRLSCITRILVGDRESAEARQGQSVTLTSRRRNRYQSRRRHRDGRRSARGCRPVRSDDRLVARPPHAAGAFVSIQAWHQDRVGYGVADQYRINIHTHEHVAARRLDLNDIGVCGLQLSQPVPFEPYADNRELGGFILIDRITNATVGAGMVHFALRRSQNVHWQVIDVDKLARAEIKGQKPCVIWFTGLSGAGKSTIANALERKLHALGCHTYLLDGDNVRHGLNKDLGFTDVDRVENIRRVAEVAHLMVDAGLIVLVSFISPFRAERRMARELVEAHEFIEVFVDTPLAVAETRDPKGLYKKARRGELKNFTGIDSPYEAPEHAEVWIDTTDLSPSDAARVVLDRLRGAGIVPDGEV